VVCTATREVFPSASLRRDAALFTDAKGYPDIWGIKIASLDDPAAVEPGMHIWTDSAQPWDHIGDELPTFPKSPPVG
jgi:hypothetical protein